MNQQDRRQKHADRLRALHQDHVLSFWDQLDESNREALLDDLDRVPYGLLQRIDREGLDVLEPSFPDLERLQPVTAIDRWADTPDLSQAREIGELAFAQGHVAAVTAAGGQGTRLGYPGPKGTFPIGPLSNHSLFQILAAAIRGATQRYGRRVPWYVMTSDTTHEATVAYFESHQNLGLAVDQVHFFRQGSLPALASSDGRMLLEKPHRLALSPNGHGGLIDALASSGCLDRMQTDGTRYLSVFQVDNPLVNAFDPTFVGLHVIGSADVSCKAIAKRDDLEGLGNFCTLDGKTLCIEYSDFPLICATSKNADNSRKYDAGGISIYVINVEFFARLVAEGVNLPIHLARKKVPFVNRDGTTTNPDRPNAIKMEKFVFDILPHARQVLIVKTRRGEEFAPVKNLEGVDSVDSCRKSLAQRACRWLARAGVAIPIGRDGNFDAIVEISPEIAQDSTHLLGMAALPTFLEPGERLYIGPSSP